MHCRLPSLSEESLVTDNYRRWPVLAPEQHSPSHAKVAIMSTAFGPTQYQWKPLPNVAKFVGEQIDLALRSSPWLTQFRERLLRESGTRLVDWLDHIAVDSDEGLAELGFVEDADANVWEHPHGIFPAITVAQRYTDVVPELGIKVDSVDHFLKTHESEFAFGKRISGDDELRMAIVKFGDGGAGELRIVERHGVRGLRGQLPSKRHPIEETLEAFRNRPRPCLLYTSDAADE